MDQAIIELYDEYTHKPLKRRVFLKRLSALAGGGAAAAALLPLLENNYAKAAMVAPDDARLETGRVAFPGASGEVKAYLAKPKAMGKYPAVVVVHENRGLNAHIEDVARRLAAEGYLALAVDFLSPLGGTPADEDQARGMFRTLDMGATVANGVAAVAYLKGHAESNGKVGTVGFCWGGGMVNQIAVHSPDVAASVAYYGAQPTPEDAAKIRSKMLLHYAGLDNRINARKDEYVAALKGSGVDVDVHVYDGANHAFNNDTNEARYHEASAKLAWRRTLDFFKANLS